MPNIGISLTGALPDRNDPYDLAKEISFLHDSLSIKYLELHAGAIVEDWLPAIKQLLSTLSVTSETMHSFSDVTDDDIGYAEEKERVNAVNFHKKGVEYCEAIGTKWLIVHPGGMVYCEPDDSVLAKPPPDDDGVLMKKVYESNIKSLVEVAEYGKEKGVGICLENGSFAYYPPSKVVEVVNQVNMDNVGVCLDTGHANVGGKLKVWAEIEKCAQNLRAVHLNDNLGKGDPHMPLGSGNLDWKQVFASLKRAKFQGVFNMEPKVVGEQDLPAVKKSISLIQENWKD
jgi:sugar phosphate isomerase/epimerase